MFDENFLPILDFFTSYPQSLAFFLSIEEVLNEDVCVTEIPCDRLNEHFST